MIDYSKMTIIHSVVGLQLAHGGPSRSIPAIADAQARAGATVHLIDTVYDSTAANGLPKIAQFRGVQGASIAGTILANPELKRVFREIAGANPSAIFHDHGLWLPQNRVVALVARDLGMKFVVSPRGMLSAWSLNRRKFSKLAMWHIWQHNALRRATGCHATSRQEADDIRLAGFEQPIAVVGNGVEIPAQLPIRTKASESKKRLLFLSRIHPVKGVKELLHAFKQGCHNSEWTLSIIGPGEDNYENEVRTLCKDLGLSNRVEFGGSVNDDEKWQHYVDADVFILPSFSENFGIVIAEAMAAGLPVITTTGTPWQCIQEKKLGWWTPIDIPKIASAIREATSMPVAELQQMGQAASKYVRSNLSWDKSAVDLLNFYASL